MKKMLTKKLVRCVTLLMLNPYSSIFYCIKLKLNFKWFAQFNVILLISINYNWLFRNVWFQNLVLNIPNLEEICSICFGKSKNITIFWIKRFLLLLTKKLRWAVSPKKSPVNHLIIILYFFHKHKHRLCRPQIIDYKFQLFLFNIESLQLI